ncbi:tryptophan-rich sensory protein [Waterburya agarophytonicola K14]|uniref:Tryptophan-rich sensory protein n=1 Tax=Waterburya agarophytonicola KI4 TaxID=2874699 RepID=A0A964BPE3_9CYAN|nr:tryptophan-rich sensory protein [Waterburya agarophytonicola]MCC0177153.1 tryptophan-rich sensory protein [Waterburya agarophytonicola KI4]
MYHRYTVNNKYLVIRQIFTLVSVVAAFAMNVVANVNPPNGLSIGEISNKFFGDVLITPANYAFAIWGIIYLGLISFGIYQVLPSSRNNLLLRRIGYKIAIASVAQIVWVICFLYRQYALSFLAMLGILLPLIAAYLYLPSTRITKWQRWLIHTPISVYLSWIVLATILNGAITLESWQWNGWGVSEEIWTIIMLSVAALITHLVAIPRLDFAYGMVFIWGVIAIAVRNSDRLLLSGTAIGLSLALIILLLSFSFYAPIHRDRENNY